MGLGSVVSAIAGGKGAKKAAKAAEAAQRRAMEEYQKGFDYISNAYNAYLPQAQQGYNNYVNTLNGDMSSFDASPYGKFYDDYTLNNTINTLQGTAAARGNLLSGNALKELQTNIQSILSSDYLNRLGQYLGYEQGLGNTALGITDALNQYRWNQAVGNAGAHQQIGNIQAAQQIAKYNNLGNIWGGLADFGMNAFTLQGSSGTGRDSAFFNYMNGGNMGGTNTSNGFSNSAFYSLPNGLYQAWSMA